MRLFFNLIAFILINTLVYTSVYSQNKGLVYIQHINNNEEISKIYNNINAPLMIIDNSVYAIDSTCISESFGGFARKSAQGNKIMAKARESAEGSKAINQRESAEGSKAINQRESAEGNKVVNNPRESVEGNKIIVTPRESAEGSKLVNKPRESAEGNVALTKPRESSEGAISFYCDISSSGILLLYLPAFRKGESIKIYYKNTFIDSKYYKIKTQ